MVSPLLGSPTTLAPLPGQPTVPIYRGLSWVSDWKSHVPGIPSVLGTLGLLVLFSRALPSASLPPGYSLQGHSSGKLLFYTCTSPTTLMVYPLPPFLSLEVVTH